MGMNIFWNALGLVISNNLDKLIATTLAFMFIGIFKDEIINRIGGILDF